MAPESPNGLDLEALHKVVRDILQLAGSYESMDNTASDARSIKLLRKVVALSGAFESHRSKSRRNFLSYGLVKAYADLLKKFLDAKSDSWTPDLDEELDFLLFCYAPREGLPKKESLKLSKEKIHEYRGPIEAAGLALSFAGVSEVSLRKYYLLKPFDEKKKTGGQPNSSRSLLEYPALPAFFQTAIGPNELATYALKILGFSDEEVRAAMTAIMTLRRETAT
jgi:hypothetical protein